MVKVNTNANIMHDCLIGNYVTVAPNAVLLGKVEIDDKAYIGANATLLPSVKNRGKCNSGSRFCCYKISPS